MDSTRHSVSDGRPWSAVLHLQQEVVSPAVIDRALLSRASQAVDELVDRFPGIAQLESIRMQLRYIEDYVAGRNAGERLSEVNIGLLTVREVEPRDSRIADLLYEVAESVRQARGE